MIGHGTATVEGPRLPLELRGVRRQAGLTQREVAEEMDWSPSKVHRIERGDVGISMIDLKALLSCYNVTDQTRVSGLIQLKRDEAARRFPCTSDRDQVTPTEGT